MKRSFKKPIALPLKTKLRFGSYKLPRTTIAKPPAPRRIRTPGPAPRPLLIEPRNPAVAVAPDLVFERKGQREVDIPVDLFREPNPLEGDPIPASTRRGIGAVVVMAIGAATAEADYQMEKKGRQRFDIRYWAALGVGAWAFIALRRAAIKPPEEEA